jgi:hypothetical protein
MKKAIKALDMIIETFKTEEKLSAFEQGQVDGLRWAKQVLEELEKTNTEV